MILTLIGGAGRGKSTVVKQIIEDLQPKKSYYIIIIITDHPQEWEDLKTNKHTILKIFPKDQRDQVIETMFDPKLLDFPKLLFIDDGSALATTSKIMVKLLTQQRHIFADVIIALHYINKLDCQMKQYVDSYALWAPISPEKLKTFYGEFIGDNLNCSAKECPMNYDIFKKKFDDNCQHPELPRDQENPYFHNYTFLKLPTVFSTKSLILDNKFSTENTILKDFEDKKPSKEEEEEYAHLLNLEDEQE